MKHHYEHCAPCKTGEMRKVVALFLIAQIAHIPTLAWAEEYDTLKRRAIELVNSGQYDGAKGLLRQAEKLNEQDADLYIRLAEIAIRQSSTDEAFNLFERARRLDPQNPEISHQFGILYFAKGRYTEAAKEFENVLRLNPKHFSGMESLGNTYFYLSRWDDALRVFSTLAEHIPEHPTVHKWLGVLHMKKNEQDLAIKEFETAIRLNPNDPDNYSGLGQIEYAMGSYDSAVANLRAAIELDPKNPNHYLVLCQMQLEEKDFQGALQTLNQSVAVNPNHVATRQLKEKLEEGLSGAQVEATKSDALIASLTHYETPHFRIATPLDKKFVDYIKINAEAYYKEMVQRFFGKDFDKPLQIYYFYRESDTEHTLERFGITDGLEFYGLYKNSFGFQTAVYTYQKLEDGSFTGWGTLFHEITHHFIHLNYESPPPWFDEGLASFLGERTRIIKGAASIGNPHPTRDRLLRELIDRGMQIKIRDFTALSSEEFHESNDGYSLGRALFYWLYHQGALEKYLQAVKKEGFGLAVMEKVLSKTEDQINAELLQFIQQYCYPASYVDEAEGTANFTQKERLFNQALTMQPDLHLARLEEARYFRERGNTLNCRALLEPILRDEQNPDYMRALWLAGDSYFDEKNYQAAIPFYEKAIPYADYDEWGYWLFYDMGQCLRLLRDVPTAKDWYRKFRALDWDSQGHPKETMVAKTFSGEEN